MSEVWKGLQEAIDLVNQVNTTEIKGKKVNIQNVAILLACDDEGNLTGLNAEVVNFHAQKFGVPVIKNRFLPANTFYLMDKSVLDLSGLYAHRNQFDSYEPTSI